MVRSQKSSGGAVGVRLGNAPYSDGVLLRSAFGIARQLLQQHIVLCMGTNPEPNHRNRWAAVDGLS
ncbi:hypothetical protein H6F92_22690 [Microcystis wesenbergii FACHB-1317]|nr:hypothetical protein [Microcystis wesenbergii]MBD2291432.1 hypothetical protein [Microcystis wesenbergii FACHB-1317]UZO75097.1 hypothetical protein M8120_19925 [Microcystis aeruginosa str. Chao 1910]